MHLSTILIAEAPLVAAYTQPLAQSQRLAHSPTCYVYVQRESMWRPRRGGHVHAHVQEGKEGRREMLGPRAGGERITYNTRRVREVEEKGEAETGEVHRDPLQDRV